MKSCKPWLPQAASFLPILLLGRQRDAKPPASVSGSDPLLFATSLAMQGGFRRVCACVPYTIPRPLPIWQCPCTEQRTRTHNHVCAAPSLSLSLCLPLSLSLSLSRSLSISVCVLNDCGCGVGLCHPISAFWMSFPWRAAKATPPGLVALVAATGALHLIGQYVCCFTASTAKQKRV